MSGSATWAAHHARIAQPTLSIAAPRQRIGALDALRGVLALVVVADHALLLRGSGALLLPARLAVLTFFVMSGYVLARAYQGRPAGFLARRLVRLWPLYAACLLAGHSIFGAPVAPGEWIWSPTALHGLPAANEPGWTLFMEAWAAPLMPALAVLARRYGRAAVLLPAGAVPLMLLDDRLYFVALFAAGAAATQWDIVWPQVTSRAMQFLGDISFSLYLTHAIVLRALGVWGLVLVLPVAWLAWAAIERPSMWLSRRIWK